VPSTRRYAELTVAANRSFTVQARTGRRRREATQGDLLEATKRLLQAGAPLASLSVEKIVAEAGVVRTTFYLHFRDKYDLIERLAAEQVAWIEQTGAEAIADPELSRETVIRTVGEIVSRWAQNHAVLSAIIELAEYDTRMRDTWRSAMHEVAGVAAQLFRSYWAKADLAPPNPDMVAEVLTWMIERSCHQIAGDPAVRDQVTTALAEVIWRVLHPQADA
jgi:AcrR family transcriptional regulator